MNPIGTILRNAGFLNAYDTLEELKTDLGDRFNHGVVCYVTAFGNEFWCFSENRDNGVEPFGFSVTHKFTDGESVELSHARLMGHIAGALTPKKNKP